MYLKLNKKGFLEQIFQNFYLPSNGQFFLIQIILKLGFSFFGLATYIGLLIHYYLSPCSYLYVKNNLMRSYQDFMLRESATFNYGYSYSLGVVILTISFVYSVHMPLVMVGTIFYFSVRYFIDGHLLLNVNKNRIESSGEII